MELVATLLQMRDSVVHPTINQEERDPELDLDFVPKEPRHKKLKHVLSHSFACGGQNGVCIFSAPES